MQLVDTHCHIQSAGLQRGERTTRELWAKAADLTPEALIHRAHEAEVTGLVCVGCDLADSKLAIDFVKSREKSVKGREMLAASIGIHPHEAQQYVASSDGPTPEAASRLLQEFAALAVEPAVVAVGECGLDYFYSHSPKAAQVEILKFQIELALEHDLPMIFHVREAFDDFWPIFESYGSGRIRGVLHSFTDTEANLQRAVQHGLYVGVNGIATFAKQPVQLQMYRTIPQRLLLLETDAPFLTPTPYRGTINEPKHIRTVAEFLSRLRDEPLDQLAEATTKNAKELFKL